MDKDSYFVSGVLVASIIVVLIAVYAWSRRRGRRIRRSSERALRESRRIVLYSRGEGPMALAGLLFLVYAPKGLAEDSWTGLFAVIIGVFGIVTWARYALCTVRKPCLVMDEEAVRTFVHGTIPWSNIEEVSHLRISVRLLGFEKLVLKIRDLEKARASFVLPLRILHKLNRSHEVQITISNMSLPGNEVARYAKNALRLSRPRTEGSRRRA